MRSYNKHSTEELERFILLYLEDGINTSVLQTDYGLLLSHAQFNQKVLRYLEHGLPGIQTHVNNHRYPITFKQMIIQKHLVERTPTNQLAREYNIPSPTTVRNWINKYTRGEKIRSTTPQPEVYTMKSKKKSHKEKMEIVQYCLANDLSYIKTAEKYHVSYNNVYSWVQKYKKHGADGLIDGRGRGKPCTIQTAEEKIRVEMMALKARNEYLEAENAALKKLNDIERELMLRERGMKRNTKPSKSSKEKDSR